MRPNERRSGLARAGRCLALLTLAAGAAVTAARADEAKALRVCADPNNLPFSNEAQAGFENKLADLVAADLGEPVAYTWHAQRRGFIRETLTAKKCDVVMGLPEGLDDVALTRPYYRSGYVFVTRADRHLDVSSITDPRLRTLKVGVQIIGEEQANPPPAHALAEEGIFRNVAYYRVYGDYREPNPPAQIVMAVAHGDVDIAAVWGPLAGYFAKHSEVPLRVVPITGTKKFAPLVFQYDIGIGVRKDDRAMQDKLDSIIARQQPQITKLLESYGIPLMSAPPPAKAPQADSRAGASDD